MDNDKGMISQYQNIIIYIVLYFSPCVRYIPTYTVKQAGRAAWLAIFFAIIFGLIYNSMWTKIMKKYQSKSYIDTIKDILGKKVGVIYGVIIFLWLSIIVSYNVRMFAERILETTTPEINIILLIILIFLSVFYVLKKGIVVLARMSEIFVLGVLPIFLITAILLIPQIKISNLIPITYKDIIPAFNANYGILALWTYINVLFIYNDKVTLSPHYKKLNKNLFIFMILIVSILIVIPIGTYGDTIVNKMPIPFLNTITKISFLNTIERVDAGIVIFWLITDFIFAVIFIYAALHCIKKTFDIENVNPLKIIYVLSLLLLSIVLAKSTFELTSFSYYILTPLNIIIGIILPMFLYIVRKNKKKNIKFLILQNFYYIDIK